MDLFPQRSQRHAMRRRALPGRRGRRRPLAHGWRPCANLAALARQREGEGKAGRKGGREKAREGGWARPHGQKQQPTAAATTTKNRPRRAGAARARAAPPPPGQRGGGGGGRGP
ncbi:unnamed protein product [Prorocentrum cordatum]|uniref:Uncharacterized protein n=1 Tax=Prorocentrum cordatum TaxID=2364126 RepID=A0ABN9SM39_9DINO|nr:unnamed protein product [Polarella glacialis]